MTVPSVPEGVVPSPDGAVLVLEQDLLDAGDPSYTLSVTVHQVGESSYCNFWMRSGGRWQRQLPERVMVDMAPHPEMLSGECLRLTADPVLGPRFQADFRLMLGLSGLTMRAGRAADTPTE